MNNKRKSLITGFCGTDNGSCTGLLPLQHGALALPSASQAGPQVGHQNNNHSEEGRQTIACLQQRRASVWPTPPSSQKSYRMLPGSACFNPLISATSDSRVFDTLAKLQQNSQKIAENERRIQQLLRERDRSGIVAGDATRFAATSSSSPEAGRTQGDLDAQLPSLPSPIANAGIKRNSAHLGSSEVPCRPLRLLKTLPAHSLNREADKNSCPIQPSATNPPNSIAIDQDQNWLSAAQCYLRSEFIEVTTVTRKEVVDSTTGDQSTAEYCTFEQVRIRCRFCAHLPIGLRPSRATAFPSSIKQVYQSFTMMQRDHFDRCESVPQDKRDHLRVLRNSKTQGACDSKQYWTYAARVLGMFDTPRGIEMTDESRTAGRAMPYYGLDPCFAPLDAIQKKSQRVEMLVDLVVEGWNMHRLIYVFLSQLQMIELTSQEQKGKRKHLEVGFKGVGCRRCCKERRHGLSRIFPLQKRILPNKLIDICSHLQRCPLCPPDVKSQLTTLLDKEHNHLFHNSELNERVWTLLGRNLQN